MSQKPNTVVRNGKGHGLDLLFQTSSEKNHLREDRDQHRIHGLSDSRKSNGEESEPRLFLGFNIQIS